MADGQPEEVVTRSLLRTVYGVNADVEASAATGRPAVVLGPPEQAIVATGLRALVVGGAGRGAPLMRLLVERGVHVVAGVLHGSDTDVEVAERLDIEHVSVPAFSEIDEEAAAAWLRHAAAADVIVVCDPPLGPGNVRNLELALEAAASGSPSSCSTRSRSPSETSPDGRATELWTQLREGAALVTSYHDAVYGDPRPGVRALTSAARGRPGSARSAPSGTARSPRRARRPDGIRSSLASASRRARYSRESSSSAIAASRRSRCARASSPSVPSGIVTPSRRSRCWSSASVAGAYAEAPM